MATGHQGVTSVTKVFIFFNSGHCIGGHCSREQLTPGLTGGATRVPKAAPGNQTQVRSHIPNSSAFREEAWAQTDGMVRLEPQVYTREKLSLELGVLMASRWFLNSKVHLWHSTSVPAHSPLPTHIMGSRESWAGSREVAPRGPGPDGGLTSFPERLTSYSHGCTNLDWKQKECM